MVRPCTPFGQPKRYRLLAARDGGRAAHRHPADPHTFASRGCCGSHDAGRALSDRLHQLRPRLDGLYFRTRHDPAECTIAPFDRATSALGSVTALTPLQDDMVALGTYLDWYRIALDD